MHLIHIEETQGLIFFQLIIFFIICRTFIKNLERERSQVILDLIKSSESFRVRQELNERMPILKKCEKCLYISSQKFCKACLLLYGLNNNNYSVGISSKVFLFI